MASTIQLKTGTGSAVPSSLTQGEVGINIDNGFIFYGSGSGNVVKKLESFTNITASGGISASETGSFGSIQSAGGISASKDIEGESYFIEGNVLATMVSTNILGLGYHNDTQIQIGRNLNPLKIVGNITASKNITATGSIHTLGHITASGNISSSGNIISETFTGRLVGQSDTVATIAGLAPNTATTQATQPNITSVGTLTSITSTGNSTLGNAATDTHTFTGHITASNNIKASGNIVTDKIIGDTFPSDSLLNLHDDNVVNENGVTLSSIGSMVIMLDSNNTGTVDKLEFRADSRDSSAGNLLATIEDNGDFTVEGNITASGDISASGTIYGRQIEQHDMSAGGFIISDTTKTYFPFGGQSHLENTNNLNQNIQKLAVAPGKPRKVNIKSVSNSTGLGNTGFSCSYWRVPDGFSGTSNLILVGEKRANSTGTNFEVVTFDFTSGVDSGSYDDVQDGDLVFMTILGDDTLSSMNVLAATAIWEWDYNNI